MQRHGRRKSVAGTVLTAKPLCSSPWSTYVSSFATRCSRRHRCPEPGSYLTRRQRPRRMGSRLWAGRCGYVAKSYVGNSASPRYGSCGRHDADDVVWVQRQLDRSSCTFFFFTSCLSVVTSSFTWWQIRKPYEMHCEIYTATYVSR